MILLTAIVIAVLFGVGAHLMMRLDAFRVVTGTVLMVNAAVLLLVSAGFGGQAPPLLPLSGWQSAADPLVQALALTVVVIGLGTTVLLVRVVVAVARDHGTADLDRLVRAEVAEGEAGEQSPSGQRPRDGERPVEEPPP